MEDGKGGEEGKWKCLVVKSGDERMDGAERERYQRRKGLLTLLESKGGGIFVKVVWESKVGFF